MRCLSLWQPWASLLVGGAKQVETRSWPIRHRGPLLIHAAKKWTRELHELANTEPFKSALASLCGLETCPQVWHAWAGKLPFGRIVGRVEVVDCFRTDDVGQHSEVKVFDPGVAVWRQLRIDRTERAFGDYTPGRFAFLCSDPVRFRTPVPFRGAQGLFEVPDEVLTAVGA